MNLRGRRGCPERRLWDQAREEELDAALERHLELCPECRAEWTSLGDFAAEVRALILPRQEPASLEQERLALVQRAAELRPAAPADSGHRWGLWATAAALLLLAGGSLMLATGDPGALASGNEAPGVSQNPSQVASRPETNPVPKRIPMPATLEAPAGRAGEELAQAAAASPAPPRTMEPSTPLAVTAPPPATHQSNTAPAGPSQDEAGQEALDAALLSAERAFARGWEAHVRGQCEVAAEHFARVGPASTLAPDAQYFQGVALARCGRSGEAIRVLTRLLNEHPHATRHDEVALKLGWLHLHGGSPAKAAPYFAMAALASHDSIRRSAARGLDQVRRTKTAPAAPRGPSEATPGRSGSLVPAGDAAQAT